uniref:HTH_Tnp_Tc3_1 domain-containing protein n=1 Tax=Heterorhabditis bacteriophora TaxID=37862 RepID=A0A1I7XGL8_HETBA
MGRASTLSLDERGQIKVLSTTGYTVKQIADVIKRSRKALMNFLRLQRNSADSITEIRGTCGIDATESTAWRILDKRPNTVRSRMKKCPQLAQAYNGERLCWARIFMRCD